MPLRPSEIANGGWEDMFAGHAAWKDSLAKISVFQLPSQFLRWAPVSKLREIVVFAAQHNLLLAIESLAQSAIGQPHCGHDVEGYWTPGDAKIIANKVRSAGGVLSFASMDEPLWFGHYFAGENACHSSIENVSERAAAIMAEFIKTFPRIRIGDIEPFPSLSSKPYWKDSFSLWAKEFRQHAGVPLEFLRLDMDWNARGDVGAIRSAAFFARRNGLRLGIIYNGTAGSSSDQKWLSSAERNIALIETEAGVIPDQAVFQTWDRHPRLMIPESADSLTSLIGRYVPRRR